MGKHLIEGGIIPENLEILSIIVGNESLSTHGKTFKTPGGIL